MFRLRSRACHCGACRAAAAREFAAIVAANYSPRELRELERTDRAARVAELERALLAPAASTSTAANAYGSPYGPEGI